MIQENQDGLRLGVWLMPDNRSSGMLETLLLDLLPSDDGLLAYSETVCKEAKEKGAPYKDVHSDKAHIHTWLAWQDEPGAQLHEAVQRRILCPASPKSRPFVKWLRDLFGI